MSEAAASPRATAVTSGLARFATDEGLARRAADGDQRAFAAIFRRYHQELYRYSLAILGDSHDAQDALQNTMVSALRALPGEHRRIELKAWLYRIAHNEAISVVRRRRSGEALDPDLIAAGPSLAQEAEARERLGNLIADLDTLPASQRSALVMRELAGLDFAAIAAALRTSTATARQTLYEARLSLRQIEAGREMGCDSVTRALSDADGRVLRRRDIRAHLRSCQSCRAFRAEIDGRSRDLAALSPLPALVAAGVLQGLLGGGGGAAGGGLAGLLGSGAAQAIGGSTALKATATVAAVAAIGGGAQRADLVDLGLPVGGDRGSSSRSAAPVGSSPAPDVARGGATSGSAPAGGATEGPRATRPPPAPAVTAVVAGGAPLRRASPATPPAPPTPDRGNSDSGPSLPVVAEKGQQTAAAHRDASRGRSAAAGRPGKPAKTAKPAEPAKPSPPDKATQGATTPQPVGKGSEMAGQAAGGGPSAVAGEKGGAPGLDRPGPGGDPK